MGPIAVPVQPKSKKRWRWLVAWTLFVFAGGIAAGPPLVEQSYGLVQQLFARFDLAKRFGLVPPPSEEELRTGTQAGLPTSASSDNAATAGAAPSDNAAPAHSQPRVAPIEVVALEKTPPAGKSAEDASGRGSGAHSQRAKTGKAPAAPATPGKKGTKYKDPFESGADGDAPPAPAAAPARKPEPVVTKSEPAPKATSKSRDSLDDLMNGVGDSGKGKKSGSREIDNMLKEVQKSNPEPAPKREVAAPTAAPLTSADISKAMAVVKARGNDCAHRTGQSGTAELNMTVGKDGKVTDVRVGGKIAGSPLASCIEKAARVAPFRPNAGGLRFDYRIDVR